MPLQRIGILIIVIFDEAENMPNIKMYCFSMVYYGLGFRDDVKCKINGHFLCCKTLLCMVYLRGLWNKRGGFTFMSGAI